MADDKPVAKDWKELVKPIKLEAGKPAVFAVKKETVPVIFVPGIMGTRLKRGGEKIWDPDDKLFMLWNYGTWRTGPAEKKEKVIGLGDFKPADLAPFEDDLKHNNKKFEKDYPGAGERGWGSVSWGTYGEILQALSKPETWPAPINAFFHLPVYACGYNWGASNIDAGKRLNKFIQDVLIAERKKPDAVCEKVIIVTHSMGGLVTRQAVKFGTASKILGVVHGVQPALGAAAAYWRMKAGFERDGNMPNPAAWVLGTNGAEVTALLGWLPGGLQLLPGPAYTDNDGEKAWLKIADDEGRIKESYPKSDAYKEIYLNEDEDDFWRLVHKPYLTPGEDTYVDPAYAWGAYAEKLEEAKAFHQALGTSAHPETQAFYGAGKDHKTVDRVVFKMTPKNWRDSVWELVKTGQKGASMVKAVAEAALNPLKIYKIATSVWGFTMHVVSKTEYWQTRGGFKVKLETPDGDIEVELQQPDGAGDGTVPESSGKAIDQQGEAAGGRKAAKAFSGIAHEPAYQAEQRGTLTRVIDAVKSKLPDAVSNAHSALKKYEAPPENTVTFTIGAVHKMLALKIKKAKGG